ALGSVENQTFPINDVFIFGFSHFPLDNFVSRIKINYYPQKLSFSEKIHAIIEEANGNYITFLDYKNFWISRKTEIQYQFMKRNDNLCMVHSDYNVCDEDGLIYHEYVNKEDIVLEKCFFSLFKKNFIVSDTVMLKKSILNMVDFSNTVNEYDLWLRLSKQNDIGYLVNKLATKRISSLNLIMNWEDYLIHEYEGIHSFLNKFPIAIPEIGKDIVRERFFKLFNNLGQNAFHKGEFKKSRLYFIRSLRYRLFNSKIYYYIFLTLLGNNTLELLRDFKKYDSNVKILKSAYFEKKITSILNNSKIISIIMIDIDDFTLFEMKYGILKRDKAIEEIVRILKEEVKNIGIIARGLADQFYIALPQLEIKDAFRIAEKIRKRINITLKLKVSSGISLYPKDGNNYYSLIKKADQALFYAKIKGKNRTIASTSLQ
ncbi:MAG TPA: diguanylate cyclase, partial [Candidatus Lokiarchaeia archaeon]